MVIIYELGHSAWNSIEDAQKGANEKKYNKVARRKGTGPIDTHELFDHTLDQRATRQASWVKRQCIYISVTFLVFSNILV